MVLESPSIVDARNQQDEGRTMAKWGSFDLRHIASAMAGSIFQYKKASKVRLNTGHVRNGVATFIGTEITVDIGAMDNTFSRLRGVAPNDFVDLVIADEVAGMTLRDEGSATSYNVGVFEAAVNLIALVAVGINQGPLYESGINRARQADRNNTRRGLEGAMLSENARLRLFAGRAMDHYNWAMKGR